MQRPDSIYIPPLTLRQHHDRLLLQTSPLVLPRTATLAVTGPSGAGKSLFLKSLFGWAASDSMAVFSKEMGAYLMVQDPSQGLTPGLSLAGHFREVGGKGWRSRAVALLEELGLTEPEFLKRAPNRLSGGERQRIMLALILMRHPRILVCDEPAASLDARSERALWKLLQTVQQRHGLGLIFATHRMDLIERHADYVLILERGRDVFFDSRQAFFHDIRLPYQEKIVGIHHSRTRQPASHPRASPSAPPKSALLEIVGLSCRLGHFRLCKDFSWRVGAGEWWWWTGPSGSGKTSLAKILAGLPVGSSHHEGLIFFKDRPVDIRLQKRGSSLRKDLQYLFQHGTLALNPALKVGPQLRRAYHSDHRRLLHFLERLHLSHLDLGHLPGAFSLGEVQRINMIRALAPHPALLICDEFLSALDPALQYDLIQFLDEQRSQEGSAMVVITHDSSLLELKPGNELRFPLAARSGGPSH